MLLKFRSQASGATHSQTIPVEVNGRLRSAAVDDQGRIRVLSVERSGTPGSHQEVSGGGYINPGFLRSGLNSASEVPTNRGAKRQRDYASKK